jgi:peroxidase
MAEKPVVGGIIGPTFACILGQQFLNLRKGDRQAAQSEDIVLFPT